MKYCILLIAFFAVQANAQSILNFNKRFVESENKWVALQTPKDSTYSYGFIYMDVIAGLTVHVGGTFKIVKDGTFIAQKLPITNIIKTRLQDNQIKVAWIPSAKLKEMDVADPPDWLESYQTDTTSAAWLFRWGSTYNGGNEIEKAMSYLVRAQKLDPNYPGLDFEFAYAYNASKQYDKAAAVIEQSLKKRPGDCNLYKELIFSELNSGQIGKAEETYKQGVAACGNAGIKTEMAFNITYTYFNLKNKEKFNYWADETRKGAPATSPLVANLTKMAELLGK
jgi:tetratricopeptide (TPR) repeat protein